MRMKPLIVFGVLALLCPRSGTAQNLVPNGSFEDFYNCPVGFAQVYQVQRWISPFNQSADYLHACNGLTTNGVPYSFFGYQMAADGDGYMGMCTYRSLNPVYREFIQTELDTPLVVGVPVCLSFKMAVGGFGSFGGSSPIYTCAGMGMKFFIQTPVDWENYLYPNTAALYMDYTPADTSQWYLVNGVYIPDSAYTHLVIGNFLRTP